jgi:hypothetical protein
MAECQAVVPIEVPCPRCGVRVMKICLKEPSRRGHLHEERVELAARLSSEVDDAFARAAIRAEGERRAKAARLRLEADELDGGAERERSEASSPESPAPDAAAVTAERSMWVCDCGNRRGPDQDCCYSCDALPPWRAAPMVGLSTEEREERADG